MFDLQLTRGFECNTADYIHCELHGARPPPPSFPNVTMMRTRLFVPMPLQLSEEPLLPRRRRYGRFPHEQVQRVQNFVDLSQLRWKLVLMWTIREPRPCLHLRTHHRGFRRHATSLPCLVLFGTSCGNLPNGGNTSVDVEPSFELVICRKRIAVICFGLSVAFWFDRDPDWRCVGC